MRVSERKNLDWHALADEFNNMVKDTTPDTAVIVVVSVYDGVPDGIEVYPAETNSTNAFYQMTEIVDFTRCKGLSCYVSTIDNKVVARIY